MANTTWLAEDGIIHASFGGDQTAATVEAAQGELQGLINELQGAGKPVHVLINVSTIGRLDSGAIKQGATEIRKLAIGRAAIIGARMYIKHVANFAIMAAGKMETFKIFATEREALDWLHQPA